MPASPPTPEELLRLEIEELWRLEELAHRNYSERYDPYARGGPRSRLGKVQAYLEFGDRAGTLRADFCNDEQGRAALRAALLVLAGEVNVPGDRQWHAFSKDLLDRSSELLGGMPGDDLATVPERIAALLAERDRLRESIAHVRDLVANPDLSYEKTCQAIYEALEDP